MLSLMIILAVPYKEIPVFEIRFHILKIADFEREGNKFWLLPITLVLSPIVSSDIF